MHIRLSLLAASSLVPLACHAHDHAGDPTSAAPLVVEREPSGPRFVDAYVESNHGCAVDRSGALWCWGVAPSQHFRMQDASTDWSVASQVRGVEGAIAVAGDYGTTCVLLTNQRVQCWQIPSRLRPEGLAPELVAGLEDAVDIEIDGGRLVARREDGSIEYSTPRGGSRSQRSNHAIDFDVGPRRRCSLDAEGGIWCWDSFAEQLIATAQAEGRVVQRGPSGELLLARVPGAVEIAVGDSNGDVVVRLANGELRVEPPTGFDTPLPVTEYLAVAGIADATAFAFGEGHGCVVRAGAVDCYGGNGFAQLGDGGSGSRPGPVRVPGIDDAYAVFASRTSSCAMHGESIACWGTHEMPEAGPEPRHVLLDDAVAVTVEPEGTCATRESGETLCWGTTTSGVAFEVDSQGIFASAQPRPLPFALGRLRKRERPCYLDVDGLVVCGVMLDATGDHIASVGEQFDEFERHAGVRDFAVFAGLCWIDDRGLQCTDSLQQPRSTPTLAKPSALAAGDNGVCVVHDRGKVACFDPRESEAPATKVSLTEVAIADVRELRGLGRCFAALDGSAKVQTFCVDVGEAGLEVSEPTPWPFVDVAEVHPTAQGLCVRTRANTFECAAQREAAITREFDEVIAAASNWEHACVVQTGGTLTCWGEASKGQLGVLPRGIMTEPRELEFVP